MVSIGNCKISYQPPSLSNISDNNGPSLCQVCFEPFKQNICIPRLLPCGHSFCHICITALKLNSIYICKCPLCRYSFPLRYDTNFPINYSLLDLLDHLQSSVMTKQSDDVAIQNDPILPSSSKINKLKFSKSPHGSSRLSHLLSKISRKDKKVADKYYISAEPPFTSTPDMSGEEDGVEVSYVETESEFSENTVPAIDSANVKSTSNRLIYVDGAALEDSSTTTTASADYSSSSAIGNINVESQMIRRNFITCKSSDQEVVQSTTQTVTTTDINANIDENKSFKSRTNLTTIWYIAIVSMQLFLVIFVLFWSLIILKIFYDDFYNTRSKSSMLCSSIEAIDEWLSLDLAQTIKCNNDSISFFDRLKHEAEVFIQFLIVQFRSIPTILTSTTFIQLYEWLLKTLRNGKEILNEYYEIVWTNLLKNYYEMIWKKYCEIISININDWKEKFYRMVHS